MSELHPALVNYRPEVRCTPEVTLALARQRAQEAFQARLKEAKRRRENRLVCPDCGDQHKIRLNRRWVCRHCVVAMVQP